MFRTTRASSDMRLWSHGGSHTTLTVTGPTPATLATAFSTMDGSSCADGQFGVVSVMSTVTLRASPMQSWSPPLGRCCWRHRSCKELLRLRERLREAVDLLARVVHGKRGPAGRVHAVARQKRHHA